MFPLPILYQEVTGHLAYIGQAYLDADFLLKRNYLGIFFKRFEVKGGKITKYELTDELKPLIKNGSVRVSAIGLPMIDDIKNYYQQI